MITVCQTMVELFLFIDNRIYGNHHEIGEKSNIKWIFVLQNYISTCVDNKSPSYYSVCKMHKV